tara:strand:+ start:422 stop:1132 length:711 start_codon:yes stop_codon:yes gene_type:complete
MIIADVSIENDCDNQENIEYEMPTATVIENDSEIEMINVVAYPIDDNITYENVKTCNKSYYILSFIAFIIFFILGFVLVVNVKNGNELRPTFSPTISMYPTPIPTPCDNTNCIVTIWNLKKNNTDEVIGEGENISFVGNDNLKKDTYNLKSIKPNLANKVSVVEILGPLNCSVQFSDSILKSNQWINCDSLYKCKTLYNGIYDLYNEAYSIDVNGSITENWNNKINSIYIKPRDNC